MSFIVANKTSLRSIADLTAPTAPAFATMQLDLSQALKAVHTQACCSAVPVNCTNVRHHFFSSKWLTGLVDIRHLCIRILNILSIYNACYTFYQSTLRAIHIRDIRYILSVIHNHMPSTYDACSICFRILMYLPHAIDWYDACSLYFAFKDCWISWARYRSLVLSLHVINDINLL